MDRDACILTSNDCCETKATLTVFYLDTVETSVDRDGRDISTMFKPFKLSVDDAVLLDLKERLSKTRWLDQLRSPSNDGWLYGTELTYIKKLALYWENEFDWRKNEAKFNAIGPQFLTTTKDGRRLHFVHRKSTYSGAKPLLISHGWPGSVYEFVKIIPMLTDKFHIVAPSIPGYFYSEPFHERGGDTRATAFDFHNLMQQLGYHKYFVQGGDWGAIIVKEMAIRYPDSVMALHTNMPVGNPPENFDPKLLSLAEIKGLENMQQFRKFGTAYQKIQGQKPQTLSYALNDSPIGLLAWIAEKFHAWTYDNMKFVSNDEILTNVMLYWVSNCIGSSIRFYFENGTGDPPMPGTSKISGGKVTVPCACVHFPAELYQLPISWLKHNYNMIRYNRFSEGGHFAALETPETMANDMKQFFCVDYPEYTRKSKL